ncbi:MAG: ADP-heptose--lipooligosaccharide heptosyltransferase II, partial [uncultured Cytophagales bacterium]
EPAAHGHAPLPGRRAPHCGLLPRKPVRPDDRLAARPRAAVRNPARGHAAARPGAGPGRSAGRRTLFPANQPGRGRKVDAYAPAAGPGPGTAAAGAAPRRERGQTPVPGAFLRRSGPAANRYIGLPGPAYRGIIGKAAGRRDPPGGGAGRPRSHGRTEPGGTGRPDRPGRPGDCQQHGAGAHRGGGGYAGGGALRPHQPAAHAVAGAVPAAALRRAPGPAEPQRNHRLRLRKGFRGRPVVAGRGRKHVSRGRAGTRSGGTGGAGVAADGRWGVRKHLSHEHL